MAVAGQHPDPSGSGHPDQRDTKNDEVLRALSFFVSHPGVREWIEAKLDLVESMLGLGRFQDKTFASLEENLGPFFLFFMFGVPL